MVTRSSARPPVGLRGESPRAESTTRDVRLRHASFDVGVPPLELATSGRASRTSPARIALLRSDDARDGRLEIVQVLAAAAEARVDWSERSAASAHDVARALTESDAVVVDRSPDFAAGERALLPRFHSIVGAASAVGNARAPRSTSRTDRLLVGALGNGAIAWERSVRLAFASARAERRRSVHAVLRSAGAAGPDSARGAHFRRVAIEHAAIEARSASPHDVLRRLVLDPEAFDVLVAEAGELEALARAAHAGVGTTVPLSWMMVAETSAMLVLGPSADQTAGSETAEPTLALANATARLLRRIGEGGAALRLGDALRAELEERIEATGDLWLDLACETPTGFAGALYRRLRTGSFARRTSGGAARA